MVSTPSNVDLLNSEISNQNKETLHIKFSPFDSIQICSLRSHFHKLENGPFCLWNIGKDGRNHFQNNKGKTDLKSR